MPLYIVKKVVIDLTVQSNRWVDKTFRPLELSQVLILRNAPSNIFVSSLGKKEIYKYMLTYL